MSLAAYKKTEYRNDIQGVRAIGAILIMVFHIWFSKVSGGVDVFFVVSGFLMTSLLLSQILGEGNLNPLLFWSQIIKRVAPSAYTVLAVSLLAGYFFLPVDQVMNLFSETLASALHFENIQLIKKGVNYLTADAGKSLVQQFWALSIQMQFYILLPLLVIPSALHGQKIKIASAAPRDVPCQYIAFIYLQCCVHLRRSSRQLLPHIYKALGVSSRWINVFNFAIHKLQKKQQCGY